MAAFRGRAAINTIWPTKTRKKILCSILQKSVGIPDLSKELKALRQKYPCVFPGIKKASLAGAEGTKQGKQTVKSGR